MCGIAGVIRGDRSAPVDESVLRRMTDAIRHRGPDGAGLRVAPGYGLGHRRLAIVDLVDGDQPMGHDGIWVTFNGEIYNFLELRAELEACGHRFRTRCDTEVLVHGYREWGDALPERLHGMFAFAIVDEREHRLFAARDRLGKKPLHWAWLGSDLWFASEIKALLELDGLSRELSRPALGEFLCLRYVPDPRTIFTAIHKLPPGHTLSLHHGQLSIRPYWQLSFAEVDHRPEAELAEETLALLDDAVRGRLMSDVPLGAFLSGGIDSYAVIDSMRRVGDGQVVACTVGFDQGGAFDEREGARAAAAATGAILHEELVTADDMLDLGWFADTFDEPFADDSAVPTYHVSRLARRHVTVALSGDGGDESFAGYRRHRFDHLENRIRRLLPRAVWGGLGFAYPKLDFMPRWLRFKRTFENLAQSPGDAYARSVSAVLPEEIAPLLRPEWAAAGDDPLRAVRHAYEDADARDALGRCAAADIATWLPGDVLVKVDRASMAVSLEVRAPLLDHRIVELAARIPSHLKLKGGRTKAFLRDALSSRLDAAALRRPKQGFSPPARSWLAGPIGDALQTRLATRDLDHVIDTAAVQRLLEQHRSGLRDRTGLLWAVWVLHGFFGRWIDR